MGACGSGHADPNATSATSPTKALDGAKNLVASAEQGVNKAVATATTTSTQVTGITEQARGTVASATTTATNASTQATSAVGQAAQFANANAPAPVAGVVQSVTGGAQSATTAVAGAVNTASTGATNATNAVAAPVQSLQTQAAGATTQVASAATAAGSASQQAEAKSRELSAQGAGGLKQVGEVANQVAAGAPAPLAGVVAPVASQLASVSASGASSLEKVNEPTPVVVLAPSSAAAESTPSTVVVTESASSPPAVVAATSTETSAREAPVSVHVSATPSDAVTVVTPQAASVRPQSPVVVNPNDSLAKQRLDAATLRVRQVKRDLAPVEVVKVAVEEFKAAKAAYDTTKTDASPVAAETPQAEETPKAEETKNEAVAEEGVMLLPVVTVPESEPSPVGEKKTAAADNKLKVPDQGKSKNGKGKRGGRGGGNV